MRVGQFLDGPAGQAGPEAGAQPAAGPASGAAPASGPAPAPAAGPASGAASGPASGAGPGSGPPLHELLLASVPAAVLRASAERLLGPLQDYDARHNAELLPTLTSFLACDGSWSACASRMYVHVNTVRYRISRIEALTGRDLSALPDRVDFFLALRGA